MGSNFYEMLEKSLGEPEVEELFLPSLSETELIVELLRALPDELLFPPQANGDALSSPTLSPTSEPTSLPPSSDLTSLPHPSSSIIPSPI